MCNLIFFACLLFSSCTKKSSEIKILWTDERATGISISEVLIKNNSDISEHNIVVRLITDHEPVAMLGNYTAKNGDIIFEPLVPFTRGLRYEIVINNERVGEIKIPEPVSSNRPILLNIYPTSDSVPENLLKIYLHFSKPMREGVSAQHLVLLQNNTDTVKNVFLDLQPELWNTERTLLTVWLDPGRIKRDLIPNKLFGTPIKEGEKYTLIISDRWTDLQGSTLLKSVSKNFIVTAHDSLSPDPKTWKLYPPKSGTKEFLNIEFNMPLDYSLLLSALHIEDENGKHIFGSWTVGEEEESVKFIPDTKLERGNYVLQVESRLEDLAGNNINRPFDVNLKSKDKKIHNEETILLPFIVE